MTLVYRNGGTNTTQEAKRDVTGEKLPKKALQLVQGLPEIGTGHHFHCGRKNCHLLLGDLASILPIGWTQAMCPVSWP